MPTFELKQSYDSIQPNWWLSWMFHVNSPNNVTVTLTDSTGEIVSKTSTSTATASKPLAQGFQRVRGSKVTLVVTVNVDANSLVSEDASISPVVGNTAVASGYMTMIADNKTAAANVNHVCLTVVGWKHGR